MKLGISITTFTTDPPRERTTNKQTNKQKRKGIEKHVKIGWWASWQQALGTEMNWLRKFASYGCTSLLFHVCVKTCTYTLQVLS